MPSNVPCNHGTVQPPASRDSHQDHLLTRRSPPAAPHSATAPLAQHARAPPFLLPSSDPAPHQAAVRDGPSEKITGGFVSRILLLVFGYAYPAYECYKTVELNKPEIEQLIFWCQYWLPFYSEAKLMFFIYLWYPRTKHENKIDRNLLELRARASDVVVNTFFDVLKCVASQSPSQKSKQQRSQVKQDDISGPHDIWDA
ncbi:hypothetical protein ZWY2020_000912 [Hordeum vulgare]|nr:hypothetical protein ZWY2020_000912 [Hordeum vulgare]